MKIPRDVEYRTLQWLEAVEAGRPPEATDTPTTCFKTWPGPALKAARRLAAHANTARGRDILWLIGVGNRGATGAEIANLEGWLAGVVPFFDGLAPRVVGYNVPAGLNSRKQPAQVVALQIETSRAPFVIRSGSSPSAKGKPSKSSTLEVPWFDAADDSVRSAGRLELVKLLAPLQDLPQFEVLEAELTFYKNPHASSASKTAYRWTLDGSLYVMPRAEARVVIPIHRCRGSLASPDGSFTADGIDFSLTADKNSPGVRVTESAALVDGLGRVFIYCCGATAHPQISLKGRMLLRIDLIPAGADRAATAVADLRPEVVLEGNQAGRWKL